MTFQLIDVATWSRREHFEQFHFDTPCTYSITLNLDITTLIKGVKREGVKLNPTLIYLISAVVNSHKEFRTASVNGNVGIYDLLHPCYTLLPKDSENFTNSWTEYTPVFSEFYDKYLSDMERYGGVKTFMARPDTPPNIFMISTLPQIAFTGLNLNIPKSLDYLLPIFTTGKYFEQSGKILLPLAIQAHHAVCDGIHIARFVDALQERINTLLK